MKKLALLTIGGAIVLAALGTFQFVSPKESSLASDRSIFESGRRSFRFTS